MVTMNKNEFFLYSITNKMIYSLDWWKGVFAFPIKNKLVTTRDGKYAIGDITLDVSIENPIYDINEEITIPENTLLIRQKEFKDKIGRILINLILIEYGFKGKLPYQKQMFSYSGNLENIIVGYINDGTFDITDIKRLYKICTFLRNLSKFITIPTTEKTFYPPEWLDGYKKTLQEEYRKKYGNEWSDNKKLVIEYEDTIMDRIKKYYSDDPTYGITMDKKTLSAFKKKYVSIGIGETIGNDDSSKAILASLSDGYPIDKESIAAIINSVIYGVSGRAIGTRDAGVVAKRLLAATHSFKITDNDCGCTDGLPVTIDRKNIKALKSLYCIGPDGKAVINTEEWYENNIGKSVNVRVPAYCKEHGDAICKICSGKNLARHENGATLLAASVSGAYLNFQLSKFHGSSYQLEEFVIDDL